MYLINWCGYTANKGNPFVTGINNATNEIPSPAPASSQAMGDYYATKVGKALTGYRSRGGYGTATPPNSIIDNVAYANKIVGSGGVYSTNIKMTNTTQAQNVEPTLQSLLNGQWDSFLNLCVTDVKKVNGPVFMEIWSEANVGNNGSAQPPAPDGPWADALGPNNAAAVARWRDWFCYIVNYFDSHGVTNVKFVMSFGMGPTAAWSNTSGNLKTFAKPVFDKEDADGKRYIDIIGADTYAKQGEGPAELNEAPRIYCKNISNTQHPNGIPLGIFESGYPGSHTVPVTHDTGGGLYPAVVDKATWYNALLIYLRKWQGQIVCWTNNMGESNGWWPEGSTPPGENAANHNILANYGGASWASYVALATDPIFNVGGSGTKTGAATLHGTSGTTIAGRTGYVRSATLTGTGGATANASAPGLSKRNASSGSAASNTATAAWHSNTIAGNEPVLTVWASAPASSPVVTTAPTGYTLADKVVSSDTSGNGFGIFVYYKENCGASEANPSITFNAGVTYIEWELSELAGLVTSGSLDLSVETGGHGTPMNVGPTGITDWSQEWAVGAVANISGTSPSNPTNGYILPGNAPIVARLLVSFKALSALGSTSFSATGDTASQWVGLIVTFIGANGTPGIVNWFGAATLTGTTPLVIATGSRGQFGAATLTGLGGARGTSTANLIARANLIGLGILHATGFKPPGTDGAGTLAGVGALTATGQNGAGSTANLTGAAMLFAFPDMSVSGSVTGLHLGDTTVRISDFPKATVQKEP